MKIIKVVILWLAALTAAKHVLGGSLVGDVGTNTTTTIVKGIP